MSLDVWLLFCITELLLCFSPGPAVFYVVSQGMSQGYKSSLAANVGIVTGSSIYFVISATGLGALLLASHNFFLIVKWIGAAYLIWLGFSTIFSKSSNLDVGKANPKQRHKVFQGGLLIELANPKTLIFFMAILPQFLDLNASLAQQILILAVTSAVIEFISLMIYGVLGHSIEKWTQGSNFIHWVDRISGGVLVSIGVSIAFIKRAEQ